MNAVSTATTRRAMLTGAAALPAVVLLAGQARSAESPYSMVSGEDRWWRLFARMGRLQAATDAYRSEIEDPAYRAWCAAADQVPHYKTRATYQSMGGEMRALTTEKPGDIASARRFLSGLVRVDKESGLRDFEASCRELMDAHDRREGELARLSALHRVDQTTARGERMDDLIYGMLWKLLTMPAPDAKAARWKFDYLLGGDGGTETEPWNLKHEHVRLAIGDVRRCLGGEA